MKQIPPPKQSIKKCHIVVSLVQGICESFKSICSKHGVTIHFKGGQTLKNILVSPKDKDTMTKKTVSSICTDVIRLTVMRNTQGSHLEHLV